MIDRVQLKHPQGKKATSMSREKYELLKPEILRYLRTTGNATLSDLSRAIKKQLKTNKQSFQGSLAWHLEWVKLDLEARHLISRVPNTSPQEYMIVP